MRTLSRRTNLAGTEGGGEPPQHGRRLAARTLAQQAGRCACCEDAPPSIPLGAFLLAATELPQVALARLEQRGDVHLALGRRRHRRPRDQLSARGVRLTDTLRDPPMFTSADPRYTADVTDRYACRLVAKKAGITSAGSDPPITRPCWNRRDRPGRTPQNFWAPLLASPNSVIAARWFVRAFCRLRLRLFPSDLALAPPFECLWHRCGGDCSTGAPGKPALAPGVHLRHR